MVKVKCFFPKRPEWDIEFEVSIAVQDEPVDRDMACQMTAGLYWLSQLLKGKEINSALILTEDGKILSESVEEQ